MTDKPKSGKVARILKSIRWEPALLAALEVKARRSGETLAAVVNRAVAEWLGKQPPAPALTAEVDAIVAKVGTELANQLRGLIVPMTSASPVADMQVEPMDNAALAEAISATPTPSIERDEKGLAWLNCPIGEKDQAKALGARWDNSRGKWYVPANVDAGKFAQWFPTDEVKK